MTAPDYRGHDPDKPVWERRRTYRSDAADTIGYIEIEDEVRTEAPLKHANLVSSECATWTHSGRHLPAIDIDLQCRLEPSTTPGHYHLFIDCPMSWKDYLKLLNVMVEVGIVNPGFVDCAERRGATFCRLPWIKKPVTA